MAIGSCFQARPSGIVGAGWPQGQTVPGNSGPLLPWRWETLTPASPACAVALRSGGAGWAAAQHLEPPWSLLDRSALESPQDPADRRTRIPGEVGQAAPGVRAQGSRPQSNKPGSEGGHYRSPGLNWGSARSSAPPPGCKAAAEALSGGTGACRVEPGSAPPLRVRGGVATGQTGAAGQGQDRHREETGARP